MRFGTAMTLTIVLPSRNFATSAFAFAAASISAGVAATPAEMEAAAKANADVQRFLEGKTIVKVIAVPKRMVNFVVR